MRLNEIECDQTKKEETMLYQQVLLNIYAAQRHELFVIRKDAFFTDEEIRKAELQLDFNELMITGVER